jgi:hypothetical protein
MYSIITTLGRRFLAQELPSGLASLVLAEMFYKFHSFTLECGAFLLTWYALGSLHAFARKQFS